MENESDIITVFTLSGLEEIHHRATLFSLTLLCYCVIILINGGLILTITLDENLHEPMYILLCNVFINGLFGTSGFYPKFLLDLLSPRHSISYAGCLIQAFVIYSSVCTGPSILTTMAYDRYVAICKPLEYHSVMTKQKVACLISFCWLSPLVCMAVLIALTSRLRLCGSHIQKLYCENWSIVKLACSSITINSIVGAIVIMYFLGHILFIVCSYMYLIRSCLKSLEDRSKFMQTCVPHLISLLNVTLVSTFDVMYSRYGSRDLPQSLHNFMGILFVLIPPIVNPLIYGLKLSKVRKRIVSLCVNGFSEQRIYRG